MATRRDFMKSILALPAVAVACKVLGGDRLSARPIPAKVEEPIKDAALLSQSPDRVSQDFTRDFLRHVNAQVITPDLEKSSGYFFMPELSSSVAHCQENYLHSSRLLFNVFGQPRTSIVYNTRCIICDKFEGANLLPILEEVRESIDRLRLVGPIPYKAAIITKVFSSPRYFSFPNPLEQPLSSVILATLCLVTDRFANV